jgi:hypothetical protein
LHADHGLVVDHMVKAPMALLQPRRAIADEGLLGALPMAPVWAAGRAVGQGRCPRGRADATTPTARDFGPYPQSARDEIMTSSDVTWLRRLRLNKGD